MEKPLVSILVPIYNGEVYLRRFLDSAVSQTLENIEIICVDDGSTDGSMEILEEYRKAYPEKLFIYKAKNHNGYSGIVRNEALTYARADYIYMCDQDDVIQVSAMEYMYSEAERYNADIVVGKFIFTLADDDGNIKLSEAYKFASMHVNNGTAILQGVEFFARLIKKDLLEEIGPQPEDLLFHDVAYMPVLQSYARNIRLINLPVYYYYRRNDSISGTQSLKVCTQSIAAERYALEHCNPKYKEYVEKMIAHRIISNLDFRWICSDILVDWIKELMPTFIENSLLAKNPKMMKQLQGFADLSDERLPERVYICAFDGRDVSERAADLAENAFNSGCEVVILDSSNCDIRENPYISDAYNAGRYDIVDAYFAIKNICENGGVYLHDSMKLVNTFNYMRLFEGFFAYADGRTFSDKVFGAVKDNEAFVKLLDTFSYDWDKKGEFITLSERIRIILVMEYCIKLNGRSVKFKSPFSLFGPEVFMVDTRFGNQNVTCITTYQPDPATEETVTLTVDTFRYMIAARGTNGRTITNTRAVPTRREYRLAKELGEIKNSNTWKLVLRLRRIGDGPFGPFLKKIFHGLLKIRAKLKGKK